MKFTSRTLAARALKKWLLVSDFMVQGGLWKEVAIGHTNAGDLGSTPGSEDPLEKEMATHSGILMREIPWTEEPGGLQSIGLQKSQTRLSD